MIHRSWRLPLALAGAAAAAGPLYLTLGVGWVVGKPMAEDYEHRQRFDAVVWKRDQVDDRDWPSRLRMADDLVGSRVLLGKTKSQILDLLGPETETAKFREWVLVYWLGPERGVIRIDSEWLVVRFDSNGRATEVQLVTD